MTNHNKETSEKIQFPYKEHDDVEITYQLAIDYYSALHLAGHKIQLEWNGGGDSGSVWLNLDKKMIDVDYYSASLLLYDKIHAFVIDQMYDVLDYGSWAGEFSAAGTADFVVEENFIGFQGTDYYSEDEFHSCALNFKIHVPKHLIPNKAARLSISMSGGYDGDNVQVYLSFRENGHWEALPVSDECKEYLFVLEHDLQNAANELLERHGGDHTYCDTHIDIIPGEDIDDEIEEFDYYTVDERPKDIWINFLDFAEQSENTSFLTNL